MSEPRCPEDWFSIGVLRRTSAVHLFPLFSFAALRVLCVFAVKGSASLRWGIPKRRPRRPPMIPLKRLSLTLLASLLLLAAAAWAEDWPNWRGPRFDGISRETGLVKSWPADGPKLAWKKELTG